MSVKGLVDAEKKALTLQRKLKKSFKSQLKELKQEIKKVEFLLSDPAASRSWGNSIADSARRQKLMSMLNETEALYVQAGNSRAAQIFKQRMEKHLRGQLTNLKANELEVKLRATQVRVANEPAVLRELGEVQADGALRELYSQSRAAGGFISGVGRGFMPDIITLETKAAGSKTLGKYMEDLYNQYEDKLKDVFVRGIVRGDSYKTMENNLMRATDITAGKANLLVRTEANAIFNESVRQTIEANPLVKGYRFRAVLDRKTSKTCQEHDGQYIPKDQVEPGVNFPPLHPNCRSTVTTVLVSENEKVDTVQRYTKNGSNQWVPVPPGMTYPEFKQRMAEFSEQRTGRVKVGTPTNSPMVTDRRIKYSTLVSRESSIADNDSRIIVKDKTKIVPNVVASAYKLDNTMTNKVSMAAKRAYKDMTVLEPEITDAMLSVVDKFDGARLDGIEYAVKTASSVEGKIARKMAEAKKVGLTPMADTEIVKNMTDVVRYTAVVEHDSIVDATLKTAKSFKELGFEVVEIENKYLDFDPDYKGMHMLVQDSKGTIFEVQIHSEQSIAAKHLIHPIYEESRKLSPTDPAVSDMKNRMKEITRTIPAPKDIDKIKSYSNRRRK